MKKVFVSGCYDIIHAGHIQFFEDAKGLGDYLIVNFASDKILEQYKGRNSSIPEDHKKVILESLRSVDKALVSSDAHPIFDFVTNILREEAHILAVTEDDKHKDEKRDFCKKHGIEFIVLSKISKISPVSTTSILRKIRKKEKVPLRVDFAGGWLDVPKFSKKGGFIVNCTISPLVSDSEWPYEKCSGLGGSGARAILDVKNGIKQEFELGVGWQDPAIINETGLCIWNSGKKPDLYLKSNPKWLKGKMLLFWTGKAHNTPGVVNKKRDYTLILKAGIIAKKAVQEQNLEILAESILISYDSQIKEGMKKLPNIPNGIAKKYLGSGYGGYALYLFKNKKYRDKASKKNNNTKIVEPYIKDIEI